LTYVFQLHAEIKCDAFGRDRFSRSGAHLLREGKGSLTKSFSLIFKFHVDPLGQLDRYLFTFLMKKKIFVWESAKITIATLSPNS
jgi:hypothetical protein